MNLFLISLKFSTLDYYTQQIPTVVATEEAHILYLRITQQFQ